MYIHQREEWPKFHWDQSALAPVVAETRHLQGRLLGQMESLGFPLRTEADLEMLTEDVVKSSAIEGEKLNDETVRSSVARRLGLDFKQNVRIDRHVEGIVEMMLDATRDYTRPLTAKRLWGWHAAMFPTGRSNLETITVGAWRTAESGPMQIVSGPFGKERIHYEAPAAGRLSREMAVFLKWLNAPSKCDPVLNAALAHFWFVTIHPFEDGNGRIARAIADLQLARSDCSAQRFYSMSAQIQRERKDYYNVLEICQKGTLDISRWMDWFLHCLKRAILASGETLSAVLAKARFWKFHADQPFNERQRNVLNRLLAGFEGKLTSSKWAKLNRCSQDTAGRDINELLARAILVKDDAGGRSTNYVLRLPGREELSENFCGNLEKSSNTNRFYPSYI